MFKLRLTFIAIALCAATAIASRAQQPDITIETKATATDIEKWLDSADPRLVAWGAYFARENADAAAMVQMQQLVQSWTPQEDAQNTLGHFRIDAMREILDTLILRKELVSLAGLNAVASSFPHQSVILASRLPLAEATPLLLAWYEKRDSKDYSAIPRIAAMMLAKAPPPGFAASVLAESEGNLEVTVENLSGAGYGHGYGSSIDCGDSMGIGHASRWPPLFDYDIEETNRFNNDPVIVEAGGDRITFHRVALNGSGSCAYPRPLNAETRHRLLAEMLGATENQIPWQVQESSTIFWENGEQFTSDLRKLVASENAKFQATAKALYVKGFLTKTESDSIRPKLSISIFDYRKPAGTPLPRVEFSDPRAIITFK
jgi:hypothetical protein